MRIGVEKKKSMNERDRRRVSRFKFEYQAYLLYAGRLDELRLKKKELEAGMGVHSPSLSSEHYRSQQTRDQRLTNYAVAMERVKDEEIIIRKQIARIEAITALIPQRYMNVLNMVYKGRASYDSLADDYCTSRSSLKRAVDSAILAALDKREPH